MHGLGKYLESVAPRLSILQQSGGVVVSGDQEYLAIRKEKSDLNRGINAVHLRHYDTRHEEIRLKTPRNFDALLAAVHGPSFKSF